MRRRPPPLSLRRWTSGREEAKEAALLPPAVDPPRRHGHGRRRPRIEPSPWTSSASAHPRDLLLDLRVHGEAVEAAVPLARLVVSSLAAADLRLPVRRGAITRGGGELGREGRHESPAPPRRPQPGASLPAWGWRGGRGRRREG
jgi:hypothetical protein